MNASTRLSVEQLASLLAALSNLAEKKDISKEDDYFKKQNDSLLDFAHRITKSSNKNRSVSNLLALDERRDDIFSRLGTVLEGHAALPFAKNEAAAKRLLAVYNNYGKGITKESYAKESAKIESFLIDFSDESLKDDIDFLLGVAELVAMLRNAQSDFAAENTRVTKEMTAALKEESAYSLKKPALSLVNDEILPYLSMMAKVKGGEYEDLLGEMQTEIKRANAAASRKSGAVDNVDSAAEKESE